MEGWYYLHKNGDLIYQREVGETAADIRESDFAVALWPCNPSNRAQAWTVLVEGLAAGASLSQIRELAEKWKCDDADALEYAKRIKAKVALNGDGWCATCEDFENLQESPAGFGSSAL